MLKKILLATGLLLLISCSQKSNKEEIFKQYVSSHNAHTIDKTMSFFTENATLEIPGQAVIYGLDKIRKLEEWDSVINSRLTMSSFEEDEDTLFVNYIVEKNDWLKLIGIDSIEYNPGVKIVFSGNKIKSIKPSTFRQEYFEKVRDNIKEFTGWVGKNNKTEMKDLFKDGKFIYDGQSAVVWLKLLSEWAESKK